MLIQVIEKGALAIFYSCFPLEISRPRVRKIENFPCGTTKSPLSKRNLLFFYDI